MSKLFSVLTFFVVLAIASPGRGSTKDYYSILGISPSATQDDIKKAYRMKARENHPDFFPDPTIKPEKEKRFKEINEANEVLSNLEKRRKYDDLLRQETKSDAEFQPTDFRRGHNAYSFYAPYVKPAEFIPEAIAKLKNASMDKKIQKALQLMDELISDPKTLERILYDTAWRFVGDDATTSEAVCKAAFLWLKKLRWVTPDSYERLLLSNLNFIKMDLDSRANDKWNEARKNILEFATAYAYRDWHPNNQTCNIF